MSVDWSGTYRFEYTEVDKTLLSSGGGRKSYLLNHLSLAPKIIAADGINIVANFVVLGNANYPNSQTGQQWGSGVNSSGSNQSQATSNVHAQNKSATNLQVRELYMKLNQEYGQFIVGRAPIQFGLGMTYSAGTGLFDHWSDVHDLVAGRFLIGNVTLTPMIGKPADFSPAQGADATDMIWNLDYNNPETQSAIGIFHRTRTASMTANDSANAFDANVNPTYTGGASMGWSSTHTNLYLYRGWDTFTFKLEAGFDAGSTGENASTGEEIKLGGYGVAMEFDFPRPVGQTQWTVRAGVASGDNPTTVNYEGYQFDRNYDVAFLMFNHPMGGYDALTSNVQRQRKSCAAAPAACSLISNEEALDEETISNAAYLSPKVVKPLSDKWDWTNTFTYGFAQTNPSRLASNDVSKDIGFEWDMALTYKPHDRFRWVNELGLFTPGSVFKEGSVGREAGFTYGFQSKAAISF